MRPLTRAIHCANLAVCYVSTPTNAFQNILEWSLTRPRWQRDLLRRIAVNGVLSDADLEEAYQNFLIEEAPDVATQFNFTGRELQAGDLPHETSINDVVTLTRMGGVQHVDLLARDQQLPFAASGLTLACGDNGSGKSGYARVLKRLCRARGTRRAIQPSVYESTAGVPQATVDYDVNGEPVSSMWTEGTPPPSELSNISVFDSESAQAIVLEKQNTIFRPESIEYLAKLASACDVFRARLVADRDRASKSQPELPAMDVSTVAGKLVQQAAASRTVSIELDALAGTLSEARAKLAVLQSNLAVIEAGDPKRRITELRSAAARFATIHERVDQIKCRLGSEAAQKLDALRRDEAAKRGVAEAASRSFPGDTSISSEQWQHLWEAARRYSEEIRYPGRPFPVIDSGSSCVLCQQSVEELGAKTLKSLDGFVRDTTATEHRASVVALRSSLALIQAVAVEPGFDAAVLSEIEGHSGPVAQVLTAFFGWAADRKSALLDPSAGVTLVDVPPDAVELDAMLEIIKKLHTDADQLEKAAKPEERKVLATAIKEQEATVAAGGAVPALKQWIAAQKRVQVLDHAATRLDTHAITRKSTELTRVVVTEALREAFERELKALGVHSVEVSLRSTGEHGELLHEIVLRDTRLAGRGLGLVLSEGELRAVALAAFIAETTLAPTASGVVFDDPTCSFDHERVDKVAKRLVQLAKTRQVIVFTHNLTFIVWLLEIAKKEGADITAFRLDRRGRETGVYGPGLPWGGMTVNQRIAELRRLAVEARRSFNTETRQSYAEYAARIYGLLRESWERGVEEVVLNRVVTRLQRGVQTNQLKTVIDLTEEDYRRIDSAMTKLSGLLDGHDKAAELHPSMPVPDELEADINDLDSYMDDVRKRRK